MVLPSFNRNGPNLGFLARLSVRSCTSWHFTHEFVSAKESNPMMPGIERVETVRTRVLPGKDLVMCLFEMPESGAVLGHQLARSWQLRHAV
jgi:hypothetical protein